MISFVLAFIAISALGIVGSMTSTMYVQSAQAESCKSQLSFCHGCAESIINTGQESKGYENSNGNCFHDSQDP